MKSLKLFGFLLSVWIIAACSKDPKTYATARIETFKIDSEDNYTQASKILQADYMFILDTSASMGFNSGNRSNVNASKREEFLAGLDTFVDSLQTEGIDFRFGFIEGNVQAGDMSALTNRGFYHNLVVTSDMSPSQINNSLDVLQDIGATLKPNTTVLLEAADKAMSNVGDSFIREGSQLVYLFVSDGDDGMKQPSPLQYFPNLTSEDEYANRLIAHKGSGTRDPAFVSARAIVAGVNTGCTPDPTFGEAPGIRLANTAKLIENKSRLASSSSSTVTASDVSHCILRASTEFPTLLEQLARDVSKPTNVFQLQVPNVDFDSVKVYLNGSKITWASDPNPTPYTYKKNTGSNAIVITPTPPASATVKITYDQFFVLRTVPPNPSAIVVTANGTGISLSSTSGFTYNAAANRIEFHGSTFAQGTIIEVSY
jgi:hypothetical protein